MENRLRRMLGVVGPVAALGATASGLPPEMAALAGLFTPFVDAFTPTGQRNEPAADDGHGEHRAMAYDSFGAAVISVYQAVGFLMTFKPPLPGYLHGLIALSRMQRRFQDEFAGLTASLSSVLLYGSTDAQESAIAVLRTLNTEMSGIASKKQGSSEAVRAFDEAAGRIGEKVVVFRKAAQADLRIGVEKKAI